MRILLCGCNCIREAFIWGSFAGLADYRYFPEPDLPPVQVSDKFIEEVQVGCSQLLLFATTMIAHTWLHESMHSCQGATCSRAADYA